jgi:hypothetical protein
MKMKKLSLPLAMAVAFASGAVTMAQVHDWHDLIKVHDHVMDAIHEMEHAQAANHYDMGGHAARAEQDLRAAEHELQLGIQYSQAH